MAVIDRWNANAERPVETLSGGESFLTSLALALALSEMSGGQSQPNSLFLDEGFGTLDTQTLDIVISALEGLRLRGRNIFVISHVEELTRRIPVRISVEKNREREFSRACAWINLNEDQELQSESRHQSQKFIILKCRFWWN